VKRYNHIPSVVISICIESLALLIFYLNQSLGFTFTHFVTMICPYIPDILASIQVKVNYEPL